jgi:predicted dehydrogenase
MVRIGVIGAGRWGPNYVRNFNEIDGVEVVAVADPREEALAAIGHRFPELQLLQDYHDLAGHEGIDGVIIATPARTHHEIGMACLQAGKHVLIEKPLAASAAEALELARYPLASGQIFMVGHIFRFHAGVNKVREILYEGTLGTVRYIQCVRTNLGPVRREPSL